MFKKIFPSNKNYIFHIFTVAGGTLIAQIITFLSSPILSRVYEPTAFGYFSIYSSTVSILAVISCARFELAIPLPEEVSDSIKIFKAASLIASILTIASLPFCLSFFIISNDPNKYSYFLYPLVIILNGLGLCLNLLHNKINNFRHSSISKILQALLITVVSIFASKYFLNEGLIIGSFFGQLASVIYLLVFLPSGIRKLIFIFSNKKELLINVFKKYNQFPKVSLLPAFLNIFSSQLPSYSITLLFGAGMAGFYFFSLRLVVMPISLIGSSINDVFFQKIIEKKNKGQQLKMFLFNNLLFLTLMGIVFFLGFFFLSKMLLPLFFGNHWLPSVIVCQVLAFSMFIKLIVSPLTMTFIALDKIKISAIWQYSYFLGLIVVCCIIYFFKLDFVKSLIFFVAHDVVSYSVALFFIFFYVYKHDAEL